MIGLGQGEKLRSSDKHSVAAANEHVHEEQHEVSVVEVANAVVHPRAVVVHLIRPAIPAIRP